MNRKLICLFLVIGGLLGAEITQEAFGKETHFPSKSIELICPWGAGGVVSIGSRIIGGTLSEFLGTPVVVINKTGGGGSVATGYVSKSKPDGYMLLSVAGANIIVMPAIQKSIGYKSTDFELLASYGMNPYFLVVKGDAPWKTLQELVADAKKEPGKLKYSTSGIGTSSHFMMEFFKIGGGGLKIDHVPFKSSPEAISAVLGGHVHMVTLGWVDVKGGVEAGKLRILATPTEKRVEIEGYPNIPTFAESGYPEVKMTIFYGIAAPAGVPKNVSDKLKEALYKTIKHPDVEKMLRNVGFTPFFKDAEEFKNFVAEEEKKIVKIAQEANIKVD